MKGLKITLLLVLGAAFVYCDQFKNYYHGQYPLIQSRGLDVLSLKRNENLNRGSNSRNVVYPAQTYDSSQQVQTESERMNLRGNLNDAAYDDNWREESPHHWRLRGQSESRSRNVDEDIVSRGEAARRQEQRDVYTNGGDVADIERQFVHTHHWRPQQQQNSESRARGATDETRPGFVHTHVWRQEPYQEQEEREAASARVARAIRGTDASDDEVIARGEDARRQEAIAEEQSRKKTRTVPSDEQPGPMENVHVADIERQYVHTHHWRPQQQQQNSESRSRNVPDEDIVNQAEDARLRDGQNADIDRSRVHTHVWRQDPYQEPDSSNEQQSSRSRTVRDVETEQQQAQQPGPMDHVHTHVWRQDPYQEEDSANDQQSSRSRTVRDVDAQQQVQPGPMDHVHTHVWRQDPYQGEEDQQQTRSRTVRDVDTQQQSGPGPMDHVHTHVWRQEPYQEQEAREAANDQQARSRAVRDTDTQQARPSPMDHVHTHVWRQEPYQEQEEREARLARAIRARNMRPDEQQIAEGEIYARNEGDGDEERIHHGQHVPDDISSQESDVSVQPRTESDSASSSNSQVHYHIPHGLQVEEPNVDTSAASETSEQTNNIAIN